MTTDPVQLVMFAIRSSIKLGQQVRQAYVDSTKRRELVLPLPNFFSRPDIVSAVSYFANDGKPHVARSRQLADLLKKRRIAGEVLTVEEETEVTTCHVEFSNLDLAAAGTLGAAGALITGDELNALITVRQWQRGADPDPSMLQRLAGTFVEIGIDYFVSVPGALNQNLRHAKAVEGFLGAMSEIKFSESKLGDLPARLFVAALETVSENPDLLSSDPKVRELVKVTTSALSADVDRRLTKLGGGDLVKAQAVGDWAELVFRSVLSSAGGLVLSDPKRFLGVDQPAEAALVSRVGESVLALVLDHEDLELDRLFSRQGVETVIKTALAVVGDHPEIIHTNQAGLRTLLAATATQLSKFDTLLTPDLLPELTRLILEKTGENLALLWPDLANRPEKHLLLSAVQTTLQILTKAPAAGRKWTVRFNSADLLVVAETILDEVVANPTWLLDEAGALSENLAGVLETTLEILRSRADARLSPTTAIAVLRAVVTKVALRQEFFAKLPAGAAGTGQPIFAAALDAIFGTIFGDGLSARAAWQTVRSETITALVNIGLGELAKVKLTTDKVATFAATVQKLTDALKQGEAMDLLEFESDLRAALAA